MGQPTRQVFVAASRFGFIVWVQRPARFHAEGANMVVLVSLTAAACLFVVFFAAVAVVSRLELPRLLGAVAAACLGGLAWALVVLAGVRFGWVTTEEALFHHLYVLGVVGLPFVGAVLVAITWRGDAVGRARRFGYQVGVSFMLPALIGIYATHIEPQWLRVDRLVVDVDAVGPTDPPIRVAVIADIQTDAFGEYERSVIEAAMAEEPDVILVAGDLTQVNSTVYERIRADGVALLSVLDAPGGTYVIDGNTDPSPETVRQMAIDAGATPLVDEVVVFEVGGVSIRLGGLSWPNNLRGPGSDFLREFADGGGSETVDLLLAHSPDAVRNSADWLQVDLVVSGHTHGGQIALPFFGPLWNVTELPREVAGGGLHEIGQTQVYVSTGVGVGRGESPKIRFGVRPSIAIITLT